MITNEQPVKFINSVAGRVIVGTTLAGLISFFGWQSTLLLNLKSESNTHNAKAAIYIQNILDLVSEVKQLQNVASKFEASLPQFKEDIDKLKAASEEGDKRCAYIGDLEQKARKRADAKERVERLEQNGKLNTRIQALELAFAKSQANQGRITTLLQAIEKKIP